MNVQDAAELMDDQPEVAYAMLQEITRSDPDNTKALYLLAILHLRAERLAEGLGLFERLVRLDPKRAAVWNGLGQVLAEIGKTSEARHAFKQANSIGETALFLSNIGSTYLTDANPKEAVKWCQKALNLDPANTGALANKGFALVAQGDWSGWTAIENSLGGKFRKTLQIGDEPQWKGEPVKRLFVYGEQGLGDEVMYASCFNDINAEKVTVECDTRLGGLFRRSFPSFEIHATRKIERDWSIGREFDAGIPCGSLPALFRPTIESCPRTPYIKPDPERVLMWKALFASFGKPVIGLCWGGGTFRTGKRLRSVGLESFRGLIERTDATFVSLQYKDAEEEIEQTGLPVRQFKQATLTDDYDDTAALIASCDVVVGIHTTAHHVAGAMGVPSLVLVPNRALWLYQHGKQMPWYAKQIYHRQMYGEAWSDCIGRINDPFVRGV